MRLAILALTFLALSGIAYAQDDHGNGGDDTAAAPTETAPAASAPDDAPSDAIADDATLTAAGCPTGITMTACVAITNTDPFADVSWTSTTMDSPSSAPAPGVAPSGDPSAYDSVEPDIVGNIR